MKRFDVIVIFIALSLSTSVLFQNCTQDSSPKHISSQSNLEHADKQSL